MLSVVAEMLAHAWNHWSRSCSHVALQSGYNYLQTLFICIHLKTLHTSTGIFNHLGCIFASAQVEAGQKYLGNYMISPNYI